MERKPVEVGEDGDVVNESFSLDPKTAVVEDENGLLFEEISFDMACVVCWRSCGPPEVSCSAGHNICNSCYHPSSMKECPAEMAINDDGKTEGVSGRCKEATARVGGAIKKTAYYQLFMKETMYECAAKELGCDKVMTGEEIHEHQNLHCPYRAFRRCGYCSPDSIKEFHSVTSLVQHVIEDHGIPVTELQGHFMIHHHGRKEVGPTIRGVLVGSENFYLLLGQDFPGKIRLWVSQIGGPRSEGGVMESATACVVSASPDIHPEKLLETKLSICPTIEVAVEMGFVEQSNNNFCLDLETKFLRGAQQISDENGKTAKNYFLFVLRILPTFDELCETDDENLPEPDGDDSDENVEEDDDIAREEEIKEDDEIQAEADEGDYYSDDSSTDGEITEEELKKAEQIRDEPYQGTTEDEREEHSARRDQALEVIEKYNAQQEGLTVVKSTINGFVMYDYVYKKNVDSSNN